jgi:hypothetical protein
MIRFRLIRGFVGVALLSGVFAVGQEPVTPVSAPVPSSLLNAKKVFISNGARIAGCSLTRSAAIPIELITSFMPMSQAGGAMS